MIGIKGEPLTLETIEEVATGRPQLELSDGSRERMRDSRAVVEEIVRRGEPIYGVNTGFGKLSEIHIPDDQLEALQINLVRSHACGLGEPLSEAESRAMVLLRANVLAKGFSGARPEIAEFLIEMLRLGVHPVIPARGSVGASGDLAPLAHLALVLIGEGECWLEGRAVTSDQVLELAGMKPLRLLAKEGLSLLNGTQAIVSVAALALCRALHVCRMAELSGCMTLEAVLGTPSAFDSRIHSSRPQRHQREVAERLFQLMAGSQIRESHRQGDGRVQDAYSLRCMPQVHGSVLASLEWAASIVEIESGSATDNPLVFPESGEVISGGNFHGAPLAHALDLAAIVMVDLAGITERRIERMINPDLNEGLPAFLTANPGTGSGFMIAHVAAVALLNEAKVLATPASIDNMPTSGGKEDHVSMGMTSALKFRQIVDLVERLVAIELLAAAEGLEYRRPLRAGPKIEAAHAKVRSISSRLTTDRPLGRDIELVAEAIRGRLFLSILD